MTHRVVVTGLGLVCSQGQSPQAVFEAWCAGRSGIGVHAIGDAPYTLTGPLAVCRDFDPASVLPRSRVSTMDRVSQLSTVAALSAWHDAGLDDLDADARDAVDVMWGTGGGGFHTIDRGYRDLFVKQRPRISPLTVVMAMNNAAASQIALSLGLGGRCQTYSIACASSAVAVGEAFHRIQAGRATLALAGGGEGILPFGMLKAWESMQVTADAGDDATRCSRPFHAGRTGLVIGEGAAALVLEEFEQARRRGATIYAEVLGFGGSCDHSHMTAPDARGQVRALNAALQDAKVDAVDVAYVNAHATATHEGDPAEVAALTQAFGAHAARLMVSSTKSMHGHLLGAAGAIELLATTLAVHHDTAPPTAFLDQLDPACEGVDHVTGSARERAGIRVALSNSFAFGGSNAVVVLRTMRG